MFHIAAAMKGEHRDVAIILLKAGAVAPSWGNEWIAATQSSTCSDAAALAVATAMQDAEAEKNAKSIEAAVRNKNLGRRGPTSKIVAIIHALED